MSDKADVVKLTNGVIFVVEEDHEKEEILMRFKVVCADLKVSVACACAVLIIHIRSSIRRVLYDCLKGSNSHCK